jgi:voltage-gated potassium channel
MTPGTPGAPSLCWAAGTIDPAPVHRCESTTLLSEAITVNNVEREPIASTRWKILRQLQRMLEGPMIVLSFVWLVLLIIELAWRLPRYLEIAGSAIWIIFIVHFGLELVIAPRKLAYLRRNWLTVVALFLPALRILRIARLFRFVRIARATRSVRLIRLVTSMNRGLRTLRRTMQRRLIGFVVVLTLGVVLTGAAGMYAFERDASEGLKSYGAALWWTAMLVASMGTEHWPTTPEGRILSFVLTLYGLAMFGYVTATLATFFLGRDREEGEDPIVEAVSNLNAEIKALRGRLDAIDAQAKRGLD